MLRTVSVADYIQEVGGANLQLSTQLLEVPCLEQRNSPQQVTLRKNAQSKVPLNNFFPFTPQWLLLLSSNGAFRLSSLWFSLYNNRGFNESDPLRCSSTNSSNLNLNHTTRLGLQGKMTLFLVSGLCFISRSVNFEIEWNHLQLKCNIFLSSHLVLAAKLEIL